jgi:hypothetical protein
VINHSVVNVNVKKIKKKIDKNDDVMLAITGLSRSSLIINFVSNVTIKILLTIKHTVQTQCMIESAENGSALCAVFLVNVNVGLPVN